MENDKQQINDIKQKVILWSGRLEEMSSRFDQLSEKVAKNKNFLSHDHEIMDFLEKLQKKEHEQAVGNYEHWLTSLLHQVFQESRLKNEKIVMDLHTDYNKVGLDILLEKDGYTEDLYNGNGGAYTNLVATGLRLIASAVTGRNFVVLDEPDCWIRLDILPSFMQVISDFSRQLNIQVLLISHHEISDYADKEFVLDNDGQGTTWIAEEKSSQEVIDNNNNHSNLKINTIEINNFTQYSTVFFNLSPYVNLITGTNNIGKSALVQALRCVFYNEKPYSFIRHDAKQTGIKIGLSNNKTIQYEAKQTSKNNKTVQWMLVDPNADEQDKTPNHKKNKNDPQDLVIKATGVNQFPDWVVQESNIGFIDGEDIQLGLQKQPASILSGTASEKAKVLSLDRESSYAKSMMELFKNQKKQAQEIIRNGEEEITVLEQKLKHKSAIDNLLVNVDYLENRLESIEQNETIITNANNWAQQWKQYKKLNQFEPLEKIKTLDLNDLSYWLDQNHYWNQLIQINQLPIINQPDSNQYNHRIDTQNNFVYWFDQNHYWQSLIQIKQLSPLHVQDNLEISIIDKNNEETERKKQWQQSILVKNIDIPDIQETPSIDINFNNYNQWMDQKRLWQQCIQIKNLSIYNTSEQPDINSINMTMDWSTYIKQWKQYITIQNILNYSYLFNDIKHDNIPDNLSLINNQESHLFYWQSAHNEQKTYNYKAIKIKTEMNNVHHSIIQFKNSLSVCPLCGQKTPH